CLQILPEELFPVAWYGFLESSENFVEENRHVLRQNTVEIGPQFACAVVTLRASVHGEGQRTEESEIAPAEVDRFTLPEGAVEHVTASPPVDVRHGPELLEIASAQW